MTDVATCTRCLAAQPWFPDADSAKWRHDHHALLQRAVFRIAPSRWAADMLERYFPDCPAQVISHGTPDAGPVYQAPLAPPRTLALPDDGIPTVAVLGAIGPDKGSRRLERLVALARARGAWVRFVLIGYMDVLHGPWQADDAVFTVHGRYDPDQLPELLAHYRVALVLYPSAGPETFSYTLSEAWTAGVPVLVPPIGALEERVRGSGAGWVLTLDEWRSEKFLLERILAVLGTAKAGARAAASTAARAMPHASLRAMTDATFACYDVAVAGAPSIALRNRERSPPESIVQSSLPAFPAARVRDALGYRPWTPPRPAPMESAQAVAGPQGLSARIAHAAVGMRHRLPGRVLYRLAPAALVERLKKHLG